MVTKVVDADLGLQAVRRETEWRYHDTGVEHETVQLLVLGLQRLGAGPDRGE